METKKPNPSTGSSRNKRLSDKSWLRYTGMASEMMLMLGVAAFAGYKVDQWCGWELPIFLILFSLAALTLFLWRLVKATGKKDG